jgi:hypothetical protein
VWPSKSVMAGKPYVNVPPAVIVIRPGLEAKEGAVLVIETLKG